MLVDCMFFQPYRSLIESQDRRLDNSNPNSVIVRRFSLSFISVVNLSIMFLYFPSIHFLSQF